MTRRETTAWVVAGALSLGLHAALFLNTGARLGNPEAPARETYRATRVTFSSESPSETAVPVPARPEPKPKKRQPEEKPAEPQPAPKPRPVPEPEPEPAPEPRPEPSPEPSTPVEQPAAASQAASSSATPPPSAAKGATRSEQAQLTEREKEAYLARLLAHIERHKRYPRVARRRGLEGRVEVSFRLLRGGGVDGLKAEGAHGLLGRAAEAAVRESLPLPAPPQTMELPLEVNFRMVFSLR